MSEELSGTDSMPGLDELRRLRGKEQPSFDDVADHIVDFVQQNPGMRAAMDGFASFLANAGEVDQSRDDAEAGAASPEAFRE